VNRKVIIHCISGQIPSFVDGSGLSNKSSNQNDQIGYLYITLKMTYYMRQEGNNTQSFSTLKKTPFSSVSLNNPHSPLEDTRR